MYHVEQLLYYKNYECRVTHILPNYKRGNNAYMVKFMEYR